MIKKSDIVLKGNVSILVILVLLASSLMGILSMNFLKQLMFYTDDSYGYYKSYYMAKAGLELALVEIDNSGIGFEHTISSGDSVVVGNFYCNGCVFHMSMQGRVNYLTDNIQKSETEQICNFTNALTLHSGESLVLPLFYDDSSNLSDILSDRIHYNTSPMKNRGGLEYVSATVFSTASNPQIGGKMDMGVLFQSGDSIVWDYLFIKSKDINSDLFRNYFSEFDSYYSSESPFQNPKYLAYIVISNPNDYDLRFCIKMNNGSEGGVIKPVKIPATKFFISSIGEYAGKSVGLQAIYQQPIPSFLIDSSIGN